ncbi:MAG: ABC transporter ATP-binding protein [Acetivibrionales bacterium]|jgi:ABC-2 type transport system ATP-binding protein
MDEYILSVQSLTKRYGSITAVNDISFKVKRGEVFGLLGPNGAGKTTTLECLEGIRQPDGGTLSIGGYNPQSQGQQLRKILGVQLQSSSFPDGIRSGEAMELICTWHGTSPRYDLLSHFGLDPNSKKQYREMSTGQKRRLHLALALACDPAVVILDEPTAGLDVQGRAQLHDSIRQLRTTGVTILLATHDMAEAETLCDRIAIIIHGQIAMIGTPEQITATGQGETRIILRTKRSCLLPGCDIGGAHFLKQTEDYGTWLCRDAAVSVMDLLKEVQRMGDLVEDLRVERPSLEERFLELIERGVQQ